MPDVAHPQSEEGASRFKTRIVEIAEAMEKDWPATARPEQLAPDGDWTTWLVLAGRGFGKTRAGAEWVRGLAETGAIGRIALIAATASDARDIMVEGESGLMRIASPDMRPKYEPSKRRLTWPNGVTAVLFSSEEPERLRGPQHGAAWLDELCAWRNLQATYDMLQFGLRLGGRPRQMITTTPKPLKLLRELLMRPDVAVTRGSTYDNRAHLAPTFLSTILRRYEGTRLGRQELNAEMLDDAQGALWTRDLIEATRVPSSELPVLRRVVVAIDPAVSVSDSSDETGLAVCGLGVDGRGYLLEDASGKYMPVEWARRAVALLNEHRADRIVAEANQGGALVEATIRAVEPGAPFKAVHATRGKITRAEPIAALSEQRRIKFAGHFPELEDQLCTFAAGSPGSPDRLDAMVWGFTELMITGAPPAPIIAPIVVAASVATPAPARANFPWSR